MQSFALKCWAYQLPFILEEMRRAERAGLILAGKNDEGEIEFMGDNKAWDRFTDQETLNAYYDESNLLTKNYGI